MSSGWGWDEDRTDLIGPVEWAEPDLEPPRERSRPAAGGFDRRQVRLAALVAGVIVLVVILVVATGGCGAAKGSAERAYLRALASPASASAQVGSRFATLLESRRGPTGAAATVAGLASSAQQQLATVQALKPPARLVAADLDARQALQLRADALQAIGQLLSRPAGAQSAALLAAQGERLVASDVIWADLVQSATQSTLAGAGISDAPVPGSRFLTGPNLVSTAAFTSFLSGGASVSAPVLRLGDHGEAVAAWQRLLNRWLASTHSTLPPLKPDGSFGPSTDAATKALQTAAKLVPDGIVGAKTRAAIQKALGGGG